MIKLNSLIRKDIIYEGLIHTVAAGVSSDMLKKWSGSGKKFQVVEKSQKIQLNFTENLDIKEFQNLLKLINNLGWFISGVLIFGSDISWKKFNIDDFMRNDFGRRWLSFQLEAKFDLEVDIGEYDILYHVSPSIYKSKILKIGLIPKAKEKILAHPERIYLVDNIQDADLISFQFQKNTKENLILVKVDFKGVRRNNPSIRLFSDPNFRNALYTLSNIPPKFLTDVGEYSD